MLLPRRWRALLFAVAVTCVVPSISAVVGEYREYHGKKVMCFFSGHLFTSGTDCGTLGYTQVFTGTVQSAVEEGDVNKRLRLVPDEVFLGGSAGDLTALTNQACLRNDIEAGQKWLFFLYTDRKTNELILGYEGRSKPIVQAEKDLAMLRRLSKLTDSGIVMGHTGRSGHRIVAQRASDGKEFSTLSNANDDYEFELMPARYHMTANTKQGLWAQETQIGVTKQGCTDLDFRLQTDGRIAGTVTTADGKGARYAQIAIIPVSPAAKPFIVFADDQGHFESSMRKPGTYIVGVGLLVSPDSQEWKSRVYYPGVSTQEQARVIELGEGEWLTGIDIKLPGR